MGRNHIGINCLSRGAATFSHIFPVGVSEALLDASFNGLDSVFYPEALEFRRDPLHLEYCSCDNVVLQGCRPTAGALMTGSLAHRRVQRPQTAAGKWRWTGAPTQATHLPRLLPRSQLLLGSFLV